MQLPYRAFWGSLVNTVLLNHSLYPLFAEKDSLVDLTYYVLKVQQGASELIHQMQPDQPFLLENRLLSLDPELLPKGSNARRLAKKA